jgi:hypothetical protein
MARWSWWGVIAGNIGPNALGSRGLLITDQPRATSKKEALANRGEEGWENAPVRIG